MRQSLWFSWNRLRYCQFVCQTRYHAHLTPNTLSVLLCSSLQPLKCTFLKDGRLHLTNLYKKGGCFSSELLFHPFIIPTINQSSEGRHFQCQSFVFLSRQKKTLKSLFPPKLFSTLMHKTEKQNLKWSECRCDSSRCQLIKQIRVMDFFMARE